MKVYQQNSANPINLTQQMFKFKGGQANVYIKGSTVYKIYHEQDEAIPLSKIQELQILNKKNILKPELALFNKQKAVIGFTMTYIDNTIPMCQIFTNSGWRRLSIGIDAIIKLVNRMRKTTQFIHDNKCIILDGNEMNYMVDGKDITIPYFIDVDSYLTPSFSHPSKVYIMSSIRDYHSKISRESDWFSFAIIACQLFLGVHPFRGGHPSYKRTDLENRMKDNISIFNKEVSVPPPTRDFNLIPKNYKEWFIELFEKGKRYEPPLLAGDVIITPVSISFIISNADFEIKLIKSFESNITYSTNIFSNKVIKTENALHIGKIKNIESKDCEVIYTQNGKPLFIKIENNSLVVKADNYTGIPLRCTDMFITNNILYLRNEDKLMEIDFPVKNDKVFMSVVKNWNIMKNASTVFSSVVYQSILGKAYLTIPSKGSCVNSPIKELDDYKIISAKYDNGVCQVVGFKNGEYNKFVLVFSENDYKIRKIENISDSSINFVCLDNGIVISITDDYMEVFHKDSSKITKISNKYTNSKTVLCKDGINVNFFTDKDLYSIKMKGGK